MGVLNASRCLAGQYTSCVIKIDAKKADFSWKAEDSHACDHDLAGRIRHVQNHVVSGWCYVMLHNSSVLDLVGIIMLIASDWLCNQWKFPFFSSNIMQHAIMTVFVCIRSPFWLIHLFIYLFICLFICLFISLCLFVCLFVCFWCRHTTKTDDVISHVMM